MSENLLPGSVRRRQVVEAAQDGEEATDVQTGGWLSSVPAEARAALVAAMLLAVATVLVPVGVGIVVGSVVSAVVGMGAAVLAFGIVLLLIGILLGLNT